MASLHYFDWFRPVVDLVTGLSSRAPASPVVETWDVPVLDEVVMTTSIHQLPGSSPYVSPLNSPFPKGAPPAKKWKGDVENIGFSFNRNTSPLLRCSTPVGLSRPGFDMDYNESMIHEDGSCLDHSCYKDCDDNQLMRTVRDSSCDSLHTIHSEDYIDGECHHYHHKSPAYHDDHHFHADLHHHHHNNSNNLSSPFHGSFSIVSSLFDTPSPPYLSPVANYLPGGSVVEAGSPQCTHLVVDEHNVKQIPFDTHPRLHVIKQEWFWASIQMDACADESMYTFHAPHAPSSTSASSANNKDTPKTLSAGSKSRKRKRLRENLAQLAHDGEADTPMYKRRSSELTHMSISASFLDDTKSPDLSNNLPSTATQDKSTSPGSSSQPAKEPLSPRQQTAFEFFQTEKNYAGILHTIIKLFKEEIEKSDQPGGPLLDPTDVKIIFGKIPPLYDVHMKIRDELSDIVADWSDSCLIGDVILKHADALMKSYPPFVNFFENTKETLEKCTKTKPRFHAFLKVCQGKQECGRQTLKELLIRPVQRLPSIMLLLKDITKRTDPSHPDHVKLNQAIKVLEEVMTHINEDKRKTEGHQVMFDIVNDIENCPPNLLSSHRKFIAKIDVIELTNELSHKGEHVSLFIFSDSLEMCKRRVKVLNAKSPGTHGAKTPQKAYKHIDVVQLSCIKRVLDIVETPDCKNVFALVTKKMNEAEKLFAFVIMDETEKASLLEKLSRAICDVTCRTDYTTLQATVDATTLNLDTSDLGNKTLSKAATRFGKRVSRAFSFNKTPRKLKRAISSMTQMSPFSSSSSSRRESSIYVPGGAATTPGRGRQGSGMTGMRLASVNDLTDESVFGNENLYSDLVDSVSLGCRTPSMARRRDTLSGGENFLSTSILSSTIYESPPKEDFSFLNNQIQMELDEVSISSTFSNISTATAAPAVNRRRDTLTGDGDVRKRKRAKRLSTMLSGEDDSGFLAPAPPPARTTPHRTPVRSATVGHSASKKLY